MKKVTIALLILLAMIFFASCDIQKKAQKSKIDTELNETITTKSYRPGDTVSIDIPNITYKDTTIYTYSKQGTTLKTVYDPNGKVSNIDCISASVDELKTEQREFIQSQKDKASEKTESVDNTFLYVIGGVVVLVFLIAFVFLFLYMQKQSASIMQIANSLKQ